MANPIGSFDLLFSYQPELTVSVSLLTNITGIQVGKSKTVEYEALSFVFTPYIDDDIVYMKAEMLLGETSIEISDYSMYSQNVPVADVRVYANKTNIAIYLNGRMAFVFYLGYVLYTQDGVVKLKAVNGTVTFEKITRPELHDWRDAIYVDYEATSESGIQSVIQQRPVQITSSVGRAIEFTYKFVKSTYEIGGNIITSYREETSDNNQMSSDGLVYYADVGIAISLATAAQVGLITRLYRLSDLDTGAIKAAQVMQQLALQRRNMVYLTMRLDYRMVELDKLIIDFYASGTQTHIVRNVIVEKFSISVKDGSYVMQVSGRRV